MVLLLPLFINKEGLKAKIALILSQKISGEVQFQAMDISFFPLPHIRIGQLNIHFSNGNKVSIASLEIFVSEVILTVFLG